MYYSYNTYPFSQSNDDDATAVNSKGRKLRGTDGSETDVDSDNSESREESDSLQSTSKPVSDNIYYFKMHLFLCLFFLHYLRRKKDKYITLFF